ncbi:MAG: hypothetical protein LUQ49_01065 [Methanomicrobiales archaeon]|nr:hypothetical protein [Methanomicrobiales archaeon]
MNPRFFADTRDLFKYDLVRALMEDLAALRHFLFVPMLTRDDGKERDRRDLTKARAGFLNRDLLAFLEECNARRERDVTRICSYFESRGMENDVFAKPFTHRDRGEYFGELLAGLRPSSLVLLDPDNGLQTRHPDEKHLLYIEISSVLEALDGASLLMVFQYYPRVDRGVYRARREKEIARETGMRPLWITDNQIIFYLLAKTGPVRKGAGQILKSYASRYPGLATGS